MRRLGFFLAMVSFHLSVPMMGNTDTIVEDHDYFSHSHGVFMEELSLVDSSESSGAVQRFASADIDLSGDNLLCDLTYEDADLLTNPFNTSCGLADDEWGRVKEKRRGFLWLLLAFGAGSEFLYDAGGGPGQLVGPIVPRGNLPSGGGRGGGNPDFPLPSDVSPGGIENTPNLSAPNPFPPPGSSSGTVNNPSRRTPEVRVTPEPATITLLGLGLCALAGCRYWLKKRSPLVRKPPPK